MELKSLEYLVYALAVVCAYFAVQRVKYGQRIVLLLANTFFIYKVSGLKSLLIVAGLITVTYFLGIAIEKKIAAKDKKAARLLLWAGIFVIIGTLCFFKFFRDSFRILLDVINQHGFHISVLVNPVGISYYSLTMTAYLIDIHHKKAKAERNYLDFYTIITFFPSIVQGPVNLYRKVAPQFKQTHTLDEKRIVLGMQRMLWGYFKKVVIADRIGILVMGILKDSTSAGFLLFAAMVFYSFQIYTDFSGGIDVIMGLSEILDIHLTENFKAPLVSQSITEYWARWHISLGEFMEKYIYYPLVLNRRVMKFSKRIPNKYLQKVFSATMASVVVFVIVGIWHGTGWNYVVYGCYQAFFVSTAVLLGPVYKKADQRLGISPDILGWKLFRILRTFVLLVFGRYLIRAKDLSQAWELLGRTFRCWNFHALFDGSLLQYGLDAKNFCLMLVCILLVVFVDVLHERGVHFRETIWKQNVCLRFAIYFLALFGILIFGIYGEGFSSASFIYQEF